MLSRDQPLVAKKTINSNNWIHKKALKSYLIILPKEFEKIAENGKNQFPIILLTT